ncbi:hypothetical protein [Flavihumibacter petaseus]|nr:hypothetical protein [Flavihumibacter petaseus]
MPTLFSIRCWLLAFMCCLLLSGLTAYPIETLLSRAVSHQPAILLNTKLSGWLQTTCDAVTATNRNYPFLAYGTDWLAFAHVLFTMLFIGPLIDPVRNKWVIQFGLIACAAIPVQVLFSGSVRHIPVYWQLIDCSFGLFGAIPLWIVYNKIRQRKRTALTTVPLQPVQHA